MLRLVLEAFVFCAGLLLTAAQARAEIEETARGARSREPSASVDASTQSSERRRTPAEELFYEGVELWDRDRDMACRKFSASHELRPRASISVKLARCHEERGRLASAFRAYDQALELNGRERQLEPERQNKQQALEEQVNLERAALEPRVPVLHLSVAPSAPNLEVWLDRAPLASSSFGAPILVDPGRHVVRASAPGYFEARSEVVAVEARVATLALTLVPEPRKPEVDRSGSASSRKTWGLVLGGLGAGALVTGAVFGVRAGVLVNRAGCDDGVCSSLDQADTLRAAGRSQTLALVFLGAGAAAVGGGVALLLSGGGGAETPEHAEMAIELSAAGFRLRGTW